MKIYMTEFREKDAPSQDIIVHAASTIEKAVSWIQQHGSEGWTDDYVDYFFAVFSMELDAEESTNDFLRYYDRFGTDISKEEPE